jgi:TonB family protein
MKMKRKIKILNSAPQASQSEIASYMDFDAVLDQHTAVNTGASGQTLKGAIIFMAVVLTGVTAYFINDNNEDNANSKTGTTTEKQAPRRNEVDTLSVAQMENITPAEIADNQSLNTVLVAPTASETHIAPEEKNKAANVIREQLEEREDTQEPTYLYVEATPVEGLAYLYAYFRENLTYPDALRKDSIEGVVLISFSVLKDSTVSNVKIVQSLGEKFDNEAIRVIDNMPKWIPATVNDTPVNSRLSIPLTFKIEK